MPVMDLGKPTAIGNTAEIYVYNDKVIKLFKDFLPDTESEYEASKQKTAHTAGLPVPLVYDVTTINGRQAIVMEYIHGRTVGDMMYEDMTKAPYYMTLSVDTQMSIHKVKANNMELMSSKLSRQILTADSLNSNQKDALLNSLTDIQHENMLCHGDFHINNLIYKDGNVTIIDWVDASAGDIKADVYRTYLLYSQHSKDLAALYLDLYCAKSGLTQEEIFVWEPIVAAARLSENTSTDNLEQLMGIVNRYYPK